MNDNEVLQSQEKKKTETDLLNREVKEPKTEKLTLKTILSYFYSSTGRTVATFSLGVLAGIIIVTALFNVTLNETGSVSGTIGGLDTYENFEIADYLSINSGGVKGNIAVQYREKMLIAQVNLNSSEQVKMTLSFNPDNLKIYSVKPVIINDESTVYSGRNFVVVNNKGESRYLILFKDSENQDLIQVKVTSENGEVNNYTVKTRAN